MARRLFLMPALFLVGSCGSPPKAPTVDESQKRPVNAKAAVDLQACRSELHNTRIVVTETTRLAESASATATRLALLQQTPAPPSPPAQPDMSNVVHTVHFAFGSVEVNVPDAMANALISQARSAVLITLRGRTDGEVEMPAESRVARGRAAAVRTWLVQSGVDPARIRTTWQPVGDHIANNGTVDGRRLNRRVEIELYRSAPQVAALQPSPAL
jgi:outer membrane protein OmpA-like peptidoglycan-associated protein